MCRTTAASAAEAASADNDYDSPNNWYVFIVGNCEEWPEGRTDQGDIGLRDAFIRQGVPASQLCYLKDDECTQQNCDLSMKRFLQEHKQATSSDKKSTFFFYYGGHGIPAGFCTLKNVANHDSSDSDDDDDDDGYTTWLYEDIAKCIDEHYGGDRVIFLLDCCASGNLHRHLDPWKEKMEIRQYVCLTPTPPYQTATDEGDEWVVNNSWIKAMQCPKGIPRLSTFMEYLADRLALLLGDQAMFTFSPNVDLNSTNWMPRRQDQQRSSSSSSFDWPRLENHIPSDGRVDSTHWRVNDTVYYKHKGGTVEVMNEYDSSAATKTASTFIMNVPPCWLNATILTDTNRDNDESKTTTASPTMGLLRVFYQDVSWIVENVRRDQLMNDLYMAHAWMLPDGIKDATIRLARSLKYIDFSWPANRTIRARDGSSTPCAAREATIVDWRDVDWKDYLDQKDGVCHKEPPFGGHVPVRWESDPQRVVLVPVDNIISDNDNEVEPFLSVVPTSKSERRQCERLALIKSIESSSKTMCHASHSVRSNKDLLKENKNCDKSGSDQGETDHEIFSVYWPQDGEYYDATAMDVDTAPLSVLASHVQFTLSGCMYCPVRYIEEGTCDLIPLHYVRPKQPRTRQGFLKMCREAIGGVLG